MIDSEASQPAGAQAPAFRLARHRPYVLFILSRLFSVGAAQMLVVAVGWTLYLRTGNPLDLGLVGLARFLPFLALFLVAGIVADRFDRRLIIGIGNGVQAAAAAGVGVVLISADGAIWPVFALLALTGAAQAFIAPAQQSVLPALVPVAAFPRAVAGSSTVVKAAQLGGPALSGAIIALAADWVFAATALASVIAAVAMLAIPVAARAPDRNAVTLSVLLGGFAHIRRTPQVLGAITIDLVVVLFGGVMGLLPVFAVDILHVGPEMLGVMRAMPAIGGLAMGFALGVLPPPGRTGPLFFVALGAFGLSILVFSLSEILWLSLLALLLYGASDMFSVYVRSTLVQLGTPDALRGRVNAVNSVSVNATNELGDFRAGLMAAAIGPVGAVAVGAGVTLAATALWWRWFPVLRRLDRLA